MLFSSAYFIINLIASLAVSVVSWEASEINMPKMLSNSVPGAKSVSADISFFSLLTPVTCFLQIRSLMYASCLGGNVFLDARCCEVRILVARWKWDREMEHFLHSLLLHRSSPRSWWTYKSGQANTANTLSNLPAPWDIVFLLWGLCLVVNFWNALM